MAITFTSGSSSTPFAPQFIEQAGQTAGELKTSAQTSANQQLQRLNDYIKNLYRVKELAKMAAKGAGSRGAAGQQNPLAVYRGLTELARQASIPIDAEIAKTLQNSNNIENTMNQLITQAGSLQAQLGSIMQSHSSGGGTSGGTGSGSGGNRGTARPAGSAGAGAGDGGVYIDIRGNRLDPVTRQPLSGDQFRNVSAQVAAGPQGLEVLRWMESTGQPLTDQQKHILQQASGTVPTDGGMFTPMNISSGTNSGTAPSPFATTSVFDAGPANPQAGGEEFDINAFLQNAGSLLPGLSSFMDPSGWSESQPQSGPVVAEQPVMPSSFFSNSSSYPQDPTFSNIQAPQFNPTPSAAPAPAPSPGMTWGDVNPFGSGNIDWLGTANQTASFFESPQKAVSGWMWDTFGQ